MWRRMRWRGVMCLTLALIATAASAADVVQGSFTTDGVTGRKATPHGWVEQKVFLGPWKTGYGFGWQSGAQPRGSFRAAAPDTAPPLPAGTYALFSLCYDAAPAFAINPDVRITGDPEPAEARLNTPAHYSVLYNAAYEEWDRSPWVHASDFFQTFVATSPYITRIATKLADKSGDHYHLTLDYAVYETGDGPPSTWKRISPVRSRFLSGGTDPIIHIFWVPFRSDEVNLTPGKTYALRLWRDPKSQSETFALVVRPDKGDGYAGGHLYVGDKPRTDLDAYAYVSGGKPGTIVNHAPVGDAEPKNLVGTAKRYGQTFRASGEGLAAADIIYATGEPRPKALPITFQLYDKPGGRPIGPAKTCYGMPLAFQARAAAVWMKGDAPLTPGREYYLEWSSPGCNTWQLNEDLPGHAYRDGEPKPDADLAMSIVEYAAEPSRTAR